MRLLSKKIEADIRATSYGFSYEIGIKGALNIADSPSGFSTEREAHEARAALKIKLSRAMDTQGILVLNECMVVNGRDIAWYVVRNPTTSA